MFCDVILNNVICFKYFLYIYIFGGKQGRIPATWKFGRQTRHRKCSNIQHTHTKTKNEIPEKIPKNKKQKKRPEARYQKRHPQKAEKKNDQMRDARNDTSKNWKTKTKKRPKARYQKRHPKKQNKNDLNAIKTRCPKRYPKIFSTKTRYQRRPKRDTRNDTQNDTQINKKTQNNILFIYSSSVFGESLAYKYASCPLHTACQHDMGSRGPPCGALGLGLVPWALVATRPMLMSPQALGLYTNSYKLLLVSTIKSKSLLITWHAASSII